MTPVVTADRVEQSLGDPEGLLVALDFDGTLAPIAEDPDEPTITPANRRAVAELHDHEQTTVAVVSGRQLSDLRPRVGIDGIRYVGNHGLEYTVDGAREVHPEASDAQDQLQEAREALTDRLADRPGIEIEDKALTATVHYRRAPDEDTPEIHAAALDVVEPLAGLRTSKGKQILELRPAIDWDKGTAVQLLAEDVPDAWSTVYIGDDTTDEDAFRTLSAGDLSVLVGERDTEASYHLPDQQDVPQLLAWIGDTLDDER